MKKSIIFYLSDFDANEMISALKDETPANVITPDELSDEED